MKLSEVNVGENDMPACVEIQAVKIPMVNFQLKRIPLVPDGAEDTER